MSVTYLWMWVAGTRAVLVVGTPGRRLVIRAVDVVRGTPGFPVAMSCEAFAVNQPAPLVAKDHHNGYQSGSDKDHYDPYPLLPVHVLPNLSPSAGSGIVLRKAFAPSA
ncbi:hypothetical protein [Arthrobacter gyeryongensis]|uniref:hypothetical protein n=1 Tax=Arthrobacter gyeryongensis TaxID=1650592 RepID=UPI0031F1429A